MTISNIAAEVWSARLQYYLVVNSVFYAMASRAYEGDAQFGKTVHVPDIVRSTTISDYGSTADIAAPEVVASTDTAINIDQGKVFNFLVEDREAVQSRVGAAAIIGAKSQGASVSLAQAIDGYMSGLIAGQKANMGHTPTAATAVDVGTYLTSLIEWARLNSIPLSSLVVVGPPEYYKHIDKGAIDGLYGDLVTASAFGPGVTRDPSMAQGMAPAMAQGMAPAMAQGMAPAMAQGMAHVGFVGVIDGVAHYSSNSLDLRAQASTSYAKPTNSQGRGDASVLYAFNREDVPLVVQINKVETYRPEKRFASAVKGLACYGGKVLKPANMARIVQKDGFPD